ncbi:MAG: sulfotransferase [Candidatus Hodarchaeota archaeon]
MSMEQIVFLTYINRSGSTFLANLLNEYEDIGVSIEARMPDGILYRSLEINKPQEIKRALEVLYSDGKFGAWNIDRNYLEGEISSLDFPIRYDQLLRTILKLFFKDRKVKVFIYKNGFYINHIEEVKSTFPEAKFIFILRDARAIYNSQKSSLNSETLKPMADNPVPVAKYYKQISSIIERYNSVDWVHVIKYEDLVSNTDYEIKKLLTFLDSNLRKDLAAKSYFEKIPQKEKHLHKNVKSEALEKRIYAWRDELSKAEVMIIERILGNVLIRYGYELTKLDNISIKDRIGYLWFWSAHYVGILRFIIELVLKRLRAKENDFYQVSDLEMQFKQLRNALRLKRKSIVKQLRTLFGLGFFVIK